MTIGRKTTLAVVLGMLLGAVVMWVGLASAGRTAPERPAVLVALAQLVETEHRRIDVLIEQGRIGDAVAALEALRRYDWPTVEQAGETAIILRHDVYGRLLRLRLDHADTDPLSDAALLEIADEGLAGGPADVNLFTSRLVALRGEILERMRRDDDALSAYERALDMNRALLDRELGGDRP